MKSEETGSAIHKVITEPPAIVVKYFPPIMLIVGFILIFVLKVFISKDAMFEDSDQFMSALISIGLFGGGMWVLLSRGYPPESNKYAVGAILLVVMQYMSDSIEPTINVLRQFLGAGG